MNAITTMIRPDGRCFVSFDFEHEEDVGFAEFVFARRNSTPAHEVR